MGLSFVNPSGFKFFIISNAIALLILSIVKSIADIIPIIDVLRFSVINGIGMLLFIGSLYIGRLTTDSKKIWFYNGFTAAGLILIIYSSSTMEIGDTRVNARVRVCHSSSAYSRGSSSLMGSQ